MIAERTGGKRRVENKALRKKVVKAPNPRRQSELTRACLSTAYPVHKGYSVDSEVGAYPYRRTGFHFAETCARCGRLSRYSISDCRRTAGYACRHLPDRKFSSRRKFGTPDLSRTPSPAPPRRPRSPTAR